ncbi:MAG TPA: MFS transporter [Bacillota bacterium]|nr:MFS transporter [Bacillota bacterium]
MNRIVYFIVIVSFLDTFVQLPIITPFSISLGASHLLTGAIVAIYSLTNMLGNVVGGHWIDNFGRKKMLLYGMIGVTIMLCFYPFAQTGVHLLIIRFLHGLFGGILIPAAFAYIGDLTDNKARGRTMAFTGASIGTSAIVGPAIGGIMAARASYESVFLFIAGLFIVTIILLVKYIEESFSSSERTKVQAKDFIPLLKNPLLMQASLAAFALMVSNGTLAFALPLKVEVLNMTSQTTGMLLSIFGIVALIVFLTPLNRMYDHFSSMSLVLTGICFIGLSLFILNYLTTFPVSIAAMIIYGFGFALIFPSMNQIVSEASTKVDRGKAYGIFYAFFSLGVVAGSAVSGFVSEMLGSPFIVSALIMLTIAFIIFVILKAQKQPA